MLEDGDVLGRPLPGARARKYTERIPTSRSFCTIGASICAPRAVVLDQLRRRGRVGVEQVFLDQEPPLAVEELEGRRRRQVDPGVARDRADSGRERLGDDREEPSGESSRSVVRLARVPSSSSSTISWKLIVPQVPIVMALIALDDGPEVISTIVDEDRLETEIGARVEPAAEGGWSELPQFRLCRHRLASFV